MSLWGQDAVKDVAEAVGIRDLGKDVTQALCRDVEFRLSLVLEEALKFMRHAKRTILWSQDISNALRNLDVEPLYGYETTRPLKFGEASIGPGQPLFYVEDEEMDFEKLINAPLPKVPREVSFTAHWLAVEGVQPSIPQNPTPTDARNVELLQKGPNVNPALAAMNSSDNTTTKPQVKHVLSKELQLYFAKVCESILDEVQRDYQTAALASLRDDPGLHQLVPYFVNFIADKVTHNIRDLFVLEQMMHMIDALTRNEKLYLPPYVSRQLYNRGRILIVIGCLTNAARVDLPHEPQARQWRQWLPRSFRSARSRRITSSPAMHQVYPVRTKSETKAPSSVHEELPNSKETFWYALWRYPRDTRHRWSRSGKGNRRPESEEVRRAVPRRTRRQRNRQERRSREAGIRSHQRAGIFGR